MTLTRITLVALAASVALSAAAPAMAFPNGPKDFQGKVQPKFPGPKGPGEFKLPPKPKGPKGPKGGYYGDAAFGALLGVGVLTAAAIAASADDDCWHEERHGELVKVCIDR